MPKLRPHRRKIENEVSNMFNANKVKAQLLDWIRATVGDATVVMGISGGKDSSVVAALCAEALGKDKVVGVLMPDGHQHDIDKSHELVDFLGIRHYVINIQEITEAFRKSIREAISPELSYVMRSNLGSRVRMVELYNVAAMIGNARVATTGNASEAYIGYCTKYGDSAGDFAPLAHLLVYQVKELGRALGLPEDLVEKVPEDGLSGKTDEDNFGFSYATLDHYIETGECPDAAIKEKIDRMHRISRHKFCLAPSFVPEE